MSEIERSHADPSESKKKPTCRCSGAAGPVTRACLIVAAVAAAALFGAASAAAQLRIDLEPGTDVRLATAAAPDVRARGGVLRMEGGGTTVIVWARSAAPVDGNDSIVVVSPISEARVDGNGNVIIVWPRSAPRVDGNGTTVIVWPRSAPRVDGNGNIIVVWPRAAAPMDGNDSIVVVWPRSAARVGGNGSTIVIWPIAEARVGGNGNTIIVWPRAAAPGMEEGDAVADLVPIEVRAGRDRKRGTLLGAGIATAFAALFCGIDRAHGDMSPGEVAGTVASGAVGGALLGYAFAPRGWRRLPLSARP